jgi:hypothetical protein
LHGGRRGDHVKSITRLWFANHDWQWAQGTRRWDIEWRQWHASLAFDTQSLAARREYAQIHTSTEQEIDQLGASVDDVLAVVEDQQHAPST